MTIETYEGIPKASNKEVIELLREQIYIVLKKADMNEKIFIGVFNTILNDIEKRLEGLK